MSSAAAFRLVSFCGIKGGVGKSLLAVHAACWLHDQGVAVAVLDADPQHTARRWLSRAEPGMIVEAVSPASEDPRGELIDKMELLAAGGFDVVVADGPAAILDNTRALLALSDLAIIPAGPGVEDLYIAGKTARLAEQEGKLRREPVKSLLVMNRVQRRTHVGREALGAAASLGIPVAEAVLGHRAAYADANGAGSVVTRMGPSAKEAAGEIEQLMTELFAGVLAGRVNHQAQDDHDQDERTDERDGCPAGERTGGRADDRRRPAGPIGGRAAVDAGGLRDAA